MRAKGCSYTRLNFLEMKWIYGQITPVIGLSGCSCTMQMLIVYQTCLYLVLVVMDRMGMKLPTWYLSCSLCLHT